MELSITTRIACFFVFSLVFLWISRRPLQNVHCHGFYRFFAFEGILLLLMLNVTVWFKDPFSAVQIISWVLLFISIAMVVHGFLILRKMGGREKRRDKEDNFAFENTVNLVENGIYRYVRHPMYGSLLFLAWGIFLKHPSFSGMFPLVLTCLALLKTARIEERENLSFFGYKYEQYICRTRMFVPFLL